MKSTSIDSKNVIITCSCGKNINANDLEKISIAFYSNSLYFCFDCSCGSSLMRKSDVFEQMLITQKISDFRIIKAPVVNNRGSYT